MFEGLGFAKSLDEEIFDLWLEEGRNSKIRYNYLLIVWDQVESEYRPVYTEHRAGMDQYETYKTSISRESLVAVYDLYSQSRIF